MTPPPHRRDRGLLLIAIFKYAKAALLIVVGLGAAHLVSAEWQAKSAQWLSHLASARPREFLQRSLGRLLHLGPRKLEALAVGAWLYATVFLVEGTGLFLQRRWAEYLTVIVTISFIPFEVFELANDVTAARIVALVLNIAVVVYLIVRLRMHGGEPAAHGSPAPLSP